MRRNSILCILAFPSHLLCWSPGSAAEWTRLSCSIASRCSGDGNTALCIAIVKFVRSLKEEFPGSTIRFHFNLKKALTTVLDLMEATPCGLVNKCRRFGWKFHPLVQDRGQWNIYPEYGHIESLETSITTYKTTWCRNSDGHHFWKPIWRWFHWFLHINISLVICSNMAVVQAVGGAEFTLFWDLVLWYILIQFCMMNVNLLCP